ncbi:MAG: Mobile element protein [uncultured Sulfurovum sp.]|uniref:Mobile element protein n=2 Tax=uncultured Sulfurovum sp. TaxID=269237 RepID=A0A6S6TFL9_9BACT|nr:MAG: Mobile element protein [uncultured Sulfurovum sp.]
MRKVDKFENTNDENFKRVVGVKRATFEVMVIEYKKSEEKRKEKHKIGGRKPKLCEEDRVLFMLEYYREYRTLYHMGLDYGISEGQASKVVRDVESVLIKSGKFSLPSKRVLYEADSPIEFVLIDATESPIQRPKKSKGDTIQGRRSNIP